VPTTAWSTLRADGLRPLGLISFSTTTNITTNTSIISTELVDDYTNDDFLNLWFVHVTSGENAGVVRRITDYTASSGTLTVAGANLSAESGSVTVEVTRYNPDVFLNHFNKARQHVFPQLSIVRNHETIVTGQMQQRYTLPSTLRNKPYAVYLGSHSPAGDLEINLFTDGGFEDWSSSTALTSWTLAGTGASVNQEQETTGPRNYMVLMDNNSARVVSASSGATTLRQTATPSIAAESVEFNVSVWVYATTASRVSADLGGSQGSTHGGTGWERLTASYNNAQGTATVTGGVNCTAGSQIDFYVDEIVLVAGQEEPAEENWIPLTGWDWTPPISGASNNGLLEFDEVLPEKRRLRILTRDVLSSVSAATDTVEIDGELTAPLLDYSRYLLLEEAANTAGDGARSYLYERSREFLASYERHLYNGSRVRLPNPRLRVPDA
jgi:hypothetical protein